MALRIIQNDILSLNVDAVVNSTNRHLIGFSGIDEKIHELGGDQLEDELLDKNGTLHLGESIWTHAFNMKCKYLIHTCCPGWYGGDSGEPVIMKSCYTTALELAQDLGCKSVAFPLISAGSMGFPAHLALDYAVTAISRYIDDFEPDMDVFLVVYPNHIKELASNKYPELDMIISAGLKSGGVQFKNLDDVIGDAVAVKGESFMDRLFKIIDSLGITDAQCYKQSRISRGTFNKLKNTDGKPSLRTACSFCIGLHLSIEETNELLACAGLALNNTDTFDAIIRYFIENKNYNFEVINNQLYNYKLDEFSIK